MIIHMYRERKFDRQTYRAIACKPICTNKWEDIPNPRFETAPPTVGYISVPIRVTCPACLDILIPKQENILTTMLANRAKARDEASVSIGFEPSYRQASSSGDTQHTKPEDPPPQGSAD